MTVAPDVSGFDGREEAGAERGRRTYPGGSGQIQRAQLWVLVPPRIVDPGARLHQSVIIPEETGPPQTIRQSTAWPKRTRLYF